MAVRGSRQVEHITVNPWASLAYLVAGVCFILALRGLSSPASSQRGNRMGIIGMTIAVVTTLVTHVPGTWLNPTKGTLCNHLVDAGTACQSFNYASAFSPDWTTIALILAAIGIGAIIGVTTARKIAMTDMPQLVAAFHSLVGLAAVLVACAAFLNPGAFGIAELLTPDVGPPTTLIFTQSRIEMGLGIAIGAITFSGSVIAFLKLNGNMGGKPIMLPGRHVINLGVLAGDPRA